LQELAVAAPEAGNINIEEGDDHDKVGDVQKGKKL
jgi:hypothetical protein